MAMTDSTRINFIKDVEEILRDLETALSIRSIYSADHPHFKSVLNRIHFSLVKLLTDWEREFPFLNLARVEGVLKANGITIVELDPSAVFYDLGRRLEARNIRDCNFFLGIEESEVAAFIELLLCEEEGIEPTDFLAERDVQHIRANEFMRTRPPEEEDQLFMRYVRGLVDIQERVSVRPKVREKIRRDPEEAGALIQACLLVQSSSRTNGKPEDVKRWFFFALGRLIEEVFGQVAWKQEAGVIAALLRQIDPDFLCELFRDEERDPEGVLSGWLPDDQLIARFLESYRELQKEEAAIHRRRTLLRDIQHDLLNPNLASKDPAFKERVARAVEEIESLEMPDHELWAQYADIMRDLVLAEEAEAAYRILKQLLVSVHEVDVPPETGNRFWSSVEAMLSTLRDTEQFAQVPHLFTEFLAAFGLIPPREKLGRRIGDLLIASFQPWIERQAATEMLNIAWSWLDRMESQLGSTIGTSLLARLAGQINLELIEAERYHEAATVQERLLLLRSRIEDERVRKSIDAALERVLESTRLRDLFERMVGEKRRVRLEAIQELQNLGTLGKNAALLKLDDPNWHLRRNALIVIERSGSPEDAERIMKLFTDGVWQVRREVLRTLGALFRRQWVRAKEEWEPRLVELAEQALGDESFQVRSEGLKLIRSLELTRTLPRLQRLYEETSAMLVPREIPLRAEIMQTMVVLANADESVVRPVIRFLADIVRKREGLLQRKRGQEAKLLAIQHLAMIEDHRVLNELQSLAAEIHRSELKRRIRRAIAIVRQR
jgi:hypothetical protein